jgi:hypothetical protein
MNQAAFLEASSSSIVDRRLRQSCQIRVAPDRHLTRQLIGPIVLRIAGFPFNLEFVHLRVYVDRASAGGHPLNGHPKPNPPPRRLLIRKAKSAL